MVRVKLFAHVRERAGNSEITLDLPSEGAVRDVLAALAAKAPQIAPLLDSCRVAVNQVFALPDSPVRAGDEIAIIPPVSGG